MLTCGFERSKAVASPRKQVVLVPRACCSGLTLACRRNDNCSVREVSNTDRDSIGIVMNDHDRAAPVVIVDCIMIKTF